MHRATLTLTQGRVHSIDKMVTGKKLKLREDSFHVHVQSNNAHSFAMDTND